MCGRVLAVLFVTNNIISDEGAFMIQPSGEGVWIRNLIKII